MLRLLTAATLAALGIGSSAQTPAGKPAENCRIAATAFKMLATGLGLAMETVTACSFDRAAKTTTCTNRFKDSRGIPTTSVAITTFASLDDTIDEIKAIPPLRRSIRTDVTTKTNSSSTKSSIANTYDAQKGLLREVGTGPTGVQYTTTYTSWDSKGRPTSGTTVHTGGKNNIALTYNDAARTQTMTGVSQGPSVNCSATFDVNGHSVSTSCYGSVSSSKRTNYRD